MTLSSQSVMRASPRRRRRYVVTWPSLDDICHAARKCCLMPGEPLVSREPAASAGNDAISQWKCALAESAGLHQARLRKGSGSGPLAAVTLMLMRKSALVNRVAGA